MGGGNERERRALIEEMIETVVGFPDHLEVEVFGAPKLTSPWPRWGWVI